MSDNIGIEFLDNKPIQDLTDEQAIIRINSDLNEAQSEKNADIIRGLRYRNIYEALNPPDETTEEGSGLIEDDEGSQSDTYYPVGAAIVDSAIAQLMALMFSSNDYMEIEADDWKDGLFALDVTAHLKKRHKEMKMFGTIGKVVQDACCYDYGVTFSRWKLEGGYQPKPKTVVEPIKLGKLTMDRRRTFSEPVWMPDKTDRSDLVKLNYFRCFHDPTATNGFEDSRYFIDHRDESLEDLMEQSKEVTFWGRYQNVPKVVAKIMENNRAELDRHDNNDSKRHFVGSRRAKIIRYWTKNHIIEMAEDIVIRRMNTMDWMLHLWKIFEKSDTFEGMGFLQRLERQQYDINATMNSRRNFQNLISDPWIIADRDIMPEGATRMTSGKVYLTNGGTPKDKIFVGSPATNSNQESMTDVQLSINTIETQSGISENSQGDFASGRRSATEVRAVAAGAGKRVFRVASKWEEENLNSIYMDQFFLEQTLLRNSEWAKYAGRQGESMHKIDPSTYMWSTLPRFMARGSISISEDPVKAQQFLSSVGMAVTLAQTGVNFNWQAIAAEMFRQSNPTDYTEFVQDPSVPDLNVPPDQENLLISLGRHVQASPANNHQEHIQSHQALMQTPDYQAWDVSRQTMVLNHIKEHEAFLQATAVQQQPAAQGGQDSADSLRGIRPGLAGVA